MSIENELKEAREEIQRLCFELQKANIINKGLGELVKKGGVVVEAARLVEKEAFHVPPFEPSFGTIRAMRALVVEFDKAWRENEDSLKHLIADQGSESLRRFFGLSYASWLTLPRVMMEAMPSHWQGQMAALLRQMDEEFPSQPTYGTRVQVTFGGKLVKTPKWIADYRHPGSEIQAMKLKRSKV